MGIDAGLLVLLALQKRDAGMSALLRVGERMRRDVPCRIDDLDIASPSRASRRRKSQFAKAHNRVRTGMSRVTSSRRGRGRSATEERNGSATTPRRDLEQGGKITI